MLVVCYNYKFTYKMEIKIASVCLYILNAFFNILAFLPLLIINNNVDYLPVVIFMSLYYITMTIIQVLKYIKKNKDDKDVIE